VNARVVLHCILRDWVILYGVCFMELAFADT